MFRQVSFAGCRKGFADAVFRKHVADPVELLRGSVGLMQYQKVGSFWLLIQRVSAGKAAIQSVGGFDHIVQPGESEQAQQVDGGFRLGRFLPGSGVFLFCSSLCFRLIDFLKNIR